MIICPSKWRPLNTVPNRLEPLHPAGQVSKQMLKHYSHIRMEAKRRAVDSIGKGARAKKAAEDDASANEAAKGHTPAENQAFPNGPAKESAKVAAVN